MLISEKLPINSTKLAQEDQLLLLTGATWSDYEKLDSLENSHYLISYLNHEITIMSPGRNHERIGETIALLILAYCRKYDIPCFPFGRTRLEEKGLEGKEPDIAYAFVTDKNLPDLAVEVNFTSGSINDLTKYKYLKIKEVWIWQNREIKFYTLQEERYQEVEGSINLKNFKSTVARDYINRGLKEDVLASERDWLKEFDS